MTGATTLYDQACLRIDEAAARLDALDLSPTLRQALEPRLTRLRRGASCDLTLVSREIEAFHADPDAGQVPLYE